MRRDVRFGSKADIAVRQLDVRSVPLAEVGTMIEMFTIPIRVASLHSLTSFRTDLM